MRASEATVVRGADRHVVVVGFGPKSSGRGVERLLGLDLACLVVGVAEHAVGDALPVSREITYVRATDDLPPRRSIDSWR